MAAINNPRKWGAAALEAKRSLNLANVRICGNCGGQGTHYPPCDGIPFWGKETEWNKDDGEALQRIQTEEEIALARRRSLAAEGITIVGEI